MNLGAVARRGQNCEWVFSLGVAVHSVQAQRFDRDDEGRLQVDGIGDEHIKEPSPQLSSQLSQQGQRARHFGFPGLLKADSQKYRERGTDERDRKSVV